MKKHRKALSNFLKGIRAEDMLRQKDVAALSKLSQGYISKLERGVSDCSFKAFIKIVESNGFKLKIKIKKK